MMSQLSGLRIVVVEDDEDSRFLLEFFLRSNGAEVESYECAAKALQSLPQSKPHLIISDIHMPEHDGYWLIEQVRRLKPWEGGETPAIALTARKSARERAKALQAGFQIHMPKPFLPDQLRIAIGNLTNPQKPIRRKSA